MFWLVLVLSVLAAFGLLSFIALVVTWRCIIKGADEFLRAFWR